MPVPAASGPIAGVILAGGLSRRMGGGDKPLLSVHGKTLLERTIERLAPQVGALLLNANGDPARFAGCGHDIDIRADVLDGYGGPLVGILTALDWAAEQGAAWLLTAAADTPLLPADLAQRLTAARAAERARLALATSGGRSHPVFALWPVDVREELRHAVVGEGLRKLGAFADRFAVAHVDWPTRPVDPFFNVNTPEDLARLEDILAGTE